MKEKHPETYEDDVIKIRTAVFFLCRPATVTEYYILIWLS